MANSKTIDKYIDDFPEGTKNILRKIRQTILKTAPKAVETISYRIPTFNLNGKHLVHFAAFKKHISFFPTSSPIPIFKKELAGYKTSKGTIQFPLDKPIPYNLVKKITAFRVKEVMNKEGRIVQKRRLPATCKNHQVVARNTSKHREWAMAAAAIAWKVLPFFERECPDDVRPREAVMAIKNWASGKRELGMKEVRALSLGAHAAARGCKTDAAKYAAHAAGQAVAAWHVPTHAIGALHYVNKIKQEQKLSADKIKICSRWHSYKGNGACPVCWPGRLKKIGYQKLKQ